MLEEARAHALAAGADGQGEAQVRGRVSTDLRGGGSSHAVRRWSPEEEGPARPNWSSAHCITCSPRDPCVPNNLRTIKSKGRHS